MDKALIELKDLAYSIIPEINRLISFLKLELMRLKKEIESETFKLKNLEKDLAPFTRALEKLYQEKGATSYNQRREIELKFKKNNPRYAELLEVVSEQQKLVRGKEQYYQVRENFRDNLSNQREIIKSQSQKIDSLQFPSIPFIIVIKMTKRIIDLSYSEAFDFMMKSEQYCTTELPEYFDFDSVLKFCMDVLKDKTFQPICNTTAGVNLDILINKDGKYGVRPITISNPFLYTFLAQTICKKEAWDKILECFNVFHVDNIRVCAIQVVADDKKKEPFHKSTTILNWCSTMEQTPIELSLKYRYMFMSDITNCFEQIIPYSIDWVLSRRGTKVATEDNHELAGNIIKIIEALQAGRNVGIPQGSTIYSLIAEIVIGYADLLLDNAIKGAGITEEYYVLRYVDDYRIFCNDRDALENISYLLQHVLESLNFRMNVSKTKISETIVADAVKPDKAFYIFNTPIFNKKGVDFDGFQKHFYFIYEFGRRFPNSGQIKVLLSDFGKRLVKYLKPRKSKNVRVVAGIDLETGVATECNKPSIFQPKIHENILSMIATLTQIASENVSVAHYVLRVGNKSPSRHL